MNRSIVYAPGRWPGVLVTEDALVVLSP